MSGPELGGYGSGVWGVGSRDCGEVGFRGWGRGASSLEIGGV